MIGDVQKQLRKRPIKTVARKPAKRPLKVTTPVKKPSTLKKLVDNKRALEAAGRAFERKKYSR